jgi:hypothetical protein
LNVVHEEIDILAQPMLESEHQHRSSADHHIGSAKLPSLQIIENSDG